MEASQSLAATEFPVDFVERIQPTPGGGKTLRGIKGEALAYDFIDEWQKATGDAPPHVSGDLTWGN